MPHRISTLFAIFVCIFNTSTQCSAGDFQAGAAVTDVTPTTLPVIVNGGVLSRTVDTISNRLNARSLALSDGETKLVMVVVDSCMMPKELLDESKELASKRTGIPTDHMLISATHTHSAASCFGALGTPPDDNYVPFLKEQLSDAIVAAVAELKPAQIGFATADAPEYTALRRWIRRPDRIDTDPFGNATVRANMHAGRNWDDVTGESGPEDPQLSLISIQTRDGKPLAVLANFSMHYFSGEKGIGADYFGRFCEGLKNRIAPNSNFVGIMSHGCSGDIWRRDYTRPESWENLTDIDEFANGLANIAANALKSVEYKSDIDLAMAEQRMTLNYRTPDLQRVEWARKIVEAMEEELPKTKEEVYALEQLILHERQQTEIVTQALRIGDIGVASTPNETYAITGLKVKAASPLSKTFVIELANGADGYIPPPEQHLLGGYNTWAARSAGLEVHAEPKIAESCISLLETVTGAVRRSTELEMGPASKSIAKLAPTTWYRLNEFAGPIAHDASSSRVDGTYEPRVTYYLEGPDSDQFCANGQVNRAAMFAGDRLRSRHPNPTGDFTVSLWLWNGMPTDGRGVAGWFLSHGHDHGLSPQSLNIGIGGTNEHTGKLIVATGNDVMAASSDEIPRWTWQHVVVVRQNGQLKAWLNGSPAVECSSPELNCETLFLGGRCDGSDNWEGRLDEVTMWDRALTAEELSTLSLAE